MPKNIKIKKVKNCFIAYIDILGFSEATKQKDQNDLLCDTINYIENAKKSLQQRVKINSKYFEDGKSYQEKEIRIQSRVFSISDSIFITTNLTNRSYKKFEVTDNMAVCEHLQRIVSHIAYLCMQRKFLIRGCIGYSKEISIVGNSLISDVVPELVKMEKDFSYPRVLMHDSLINYFSSKNSDLYRTYCAGLLPFRQHFKLDSDGLYFLNWLGYFKIFKDRKMYEGSNPKEGVIDITFLEKIIDDRLSKFYLTNLKNFSKWFWIKTYFNNVLKEKESILSNVKKIFPELS